MKKLQISFIILILFSFFSCNPQQKHVRTKIESSQKTITPEIIPNRYNVAFLSHGWCLQHGANCAI